MDERSALASAQSGRCEIDREIAHGWMATVFLAVSHFATTHQPRPT